MVNLFHGQGAFNEEELKEFLELYERYGKHNWVDEINLGDEVNPRIQGIVNELGKNMGRLTDRLALTIVELSKKKSQHSGDCTIYHSLANGAPESGICTCGYGLQVMRDTGDNKELYLKELLIGAGIK